MGEGLRLGENEPYEVTLDYHELFLVGPEETLLDDLWVEDSHGQRHRAKNGRKNVMLLRTGATTTG